MHIHEHTYSVSTRVCRHSAEHLHIAAMATHRPYHAPQCQPNTPCAVRAVAISAHCPRNASQAPPFTQPAFPPPRLLQPARTRIRLPQTISPTHPVARGSALFSRCFLRSTPRAVAGVAGCNQFTATGRVIKNQKLVYGVRQGTQGPRGKGNMAVPDPRLITHPHEMTTCQSVAGCKRVLLLPELFEPLNISHIRPRGRLVFLVHVISTGAQLDLAKSTPIACSMQDSARMRCIGARR